MKIQYKCLSHYVKRPEAESLLSLQHIRDYCKLIVHTSGPNQETTYRKTTDVEETDGVVHLASNLPWSHWTSYSGCPACSCKRVNNLKNKLHLEGDSKLNIKKFTRLTLGSMDQFTAINRMKSLEMTLHSKTSLLQMLWYWYQTECIIHLNTSKSSNSQIPRMPCRPRSGLSPPLYLLDLDRLAELPDFTAWCIEASRPRSRHFLQSGLTTLNFLFRLARCSLASPRCSSAPQWKQHWGTPSLQLKYTTSTGLAQFRPQRTTTTSASEGVSASTS